LEDVSAEKKLKANELEELKAFEERIEILCKTAFENDVPILIDAEDFSFQKAIDDVVTAMMEKFNKEKAIVFNTLQMYRWDRLAFMIKP
jgi:proline dehydrogenase